MKRAAAFLVVCLLVAIPLWASYTIYVTGLNPSQWTTCTFNGNLIFYGGPGTGSCISALAVPDGTSDYDMTINLQYASGDSPQGGIMLRASGDAYYQGSGYSGSFYLVSFNGNYLNVSRIVGGSETILGYIYVSSIHSGMQLRAAMHGNMIKAVVDNNAAWSMYAWDSSLSTGKPGFLFSNPNGMSISQMSLRTIDHIAPTPPPPQGIGTSVWPNRVDMQWQGGVDDAGGVGVTGHQLWRGGTWLKADSLDTFSDNAVSPSTSYTYTLITVDGDDNYSAPTTFTVTTPPLGSVDPRRTGIRPTGAYWGAMGEQIDLLSVNLNYTLPLLKAQGRGGWGVGLNLTYNSQNWRSDPGGIWNLGRDLGYGYGWKLLAGALTPYWQDYWTLHHYTFTDATGAEYRLDQNSGGVWTSKESIYVSYDSNAQRLYLRDGSFWVLGSTSAIGEPDAGTMYPTLMQDTNGNYLS